MPPKGVLVDLGARGDCDLRGSESDVGRRVFEHFGEYAGALEGKALQLGLREAESLVSESFELDAEVVVFHPAVDGPARHAGQPGAFRHGRRDDEVWEGGDLSVGKGDRIVIGRLVCGIELLYICGIVRHLGTFSFGDYLMDCDMSATLRDIGATFSAITVTKCDAPTAPVCAPAARERGRGPVVGIRKD